MFAAEDPADVPVLECVLFFDGLVGQHSDAGPVLSRCLDPPDILPEPQAGAVGSQTRVDDSGACDPGNRKATQRETKAPVHDTCAATRAAVHKHRPNGDRSGEDSASLGIRDPNEVVQIAVGVFAKSQKLSSRFRDACPTLSSRRFGIGPDFALTAEVVGFSDNSGNGGQYTRAESTTRKDF
jgi:hypothetical protein